MMANGRSFVCASQIAFECFAVWAGVILYVALLRVVGFQQVWIFARAEQAFRLANSWVAGEITFERAFVGRLVVLTRAHKISTRCISVRIRNPEPGSLPRWPPFRPGRRLF